MCGSSIARSVSMTNSSTINHDDILKTSLNHSLDELTHYKKSGESSMYEQLVPTTNTGNWTIETSNRQLVRAFYNSVFLASLNTPIEWTGDYASCKPGTTSSKFKNSVLTRVNYFRAMVGVPANITLDPALSAKAQQAAFMMSRNKTLSHYPPNTWNCYTTDGHEAASKSNLSLGNYGWNAIASQMRDNGPNNTTVGHRRWIILPQLQKIGTGDVPSGSGNSTANALWVFDGNSHSERPTTRDHFVAWPTKGFNPYQVVPARWSFSYPNADFSNTTVTMSQNGSDVPVTVETLVNNLGENTIVWRPHDKEASGTWPQPDNDSRYTVSISNVMINGTYQDFEYPVTVFDPATGLSGEEKAIISGDATPNAGVATSYIFNTTAIAENYLLRIMEIADANKTHDAEDKGASIVDGTGDNYSLISSSSGVNGSSVYLLAPSLTTQYVELPETYVIAPNSEISFESKLGYAFPNQTAAMQISTDDGTSWSNIYSISGVSSDFTPLETSFSQHTASLSKYEGKLAKFRASFLASGRRYDSTSAIVSFLIDNIQVSNAKEVTVDSVQNIGDSTTFSLTPERGKNYALSVSGMPWDGYPGMEWWPLLYVSTAQSNEAPTATNNSDSALRQRNPNTKITF
ncbi:MAG: Cysteine-rich secretory protein family protein [uncultured Thiotrichaceae bacterium]|uniref:Cysteine-rich secretory protein family protein n=1 Tax=uncultured Thiotrichaceae bacterium TaxID=298394 RepID=A0A6S6TNE1_9GAMM|nr:MAG: Cysteine-rich secretory protein family protein [uncultured Thiotrichaceae bacterium]